MRKDLKLKISTRAKPLGLAARLIGAMMMMIVGFASPAFAEGSYADITIDRSTPEKHLKTFLSAVERLAIRMEAREWARNFYDAWFYPPISETSAAETKLLKTYVLDSMDLSGFPEWRRDTAGIETALMLREIFRAENVTSETQFKQLRDGLWVLPETYVQAGMINTGRRTGDVVFTADAVADVPQLYSLTPASQETSGFNAYRYFTETPGGLDPPTWAGIAHKLPEPLRYSFGSNTVFQWLITALILAFVLLIPKLIARFLRNPGLRWFCRAALTGLFANQAAGIVIDQAGLSGAAATGIALVFLALYYGAIVICIFVIGEWIGNWLSSAQQAKDKTFDTSIIRLATRIVAVMASIAVIIQALSVAGVPVYGIIAGFGVGGLAVALAAKPTLENILGGVILYLDGSIKVGDKIDNSSVAGVVEDIGMRSTRIRSADGGMISVTNSDLAGMIIRNVSPRIMVTPGSQPAAAVQGVSK